MRGRGLMVTDLLYLYIVYTYLLSHTKSGDAIAFKYVSIILKCTNLSVPDSYSMIYVDCDI